MTDRIALLHTISREAGACLRRFYDTGVAIRKKGALDLVTEADETAERLVLDALRRHVPDDAVLAEESGTRDGASGYRWIIDPLDGTTNFSHGLPQFAVSIALEQAGEVVAGVVFDPVKDEFFAAQKGKGATCNGRPMHVGETTDLNDALAATGYSYDRRTRMDELLDRTRRILMNCRGLRRWGSAALDLAYVARGRYDVFLEDGLSAWDIAAGMLLVTEAGGVTSRFDGRPGDPHAGEVLACNGRLHPLALEHLFP